MPGLLVEFNGAGEESVFFGETRETQLTSLRRHIVTASMRLASCKKEDTSHFEIIKKQLQLMEAFVKLNSAWKNKENTICNVGR